MSEGPFVTQDDWYEHLQKDPKLAHGIWKYIRKYVPVFGYSKSEIDAFFEGESANKKQVDWARITSKPGTFPPSAHTLASHSTKAHAELTDVTPDLHHPQSHTLVSHTARDHHHLVGLADDDHSQYYNSARHTQAVHTALSLALTTRPLDNFGACSDNVLLNATTEKHGLLMKLGGGTANFLRADGAWVVPPPAGHWASHEVGGGDPVHHDSLTDFLADEHIDWKGTDEHLQTGGYGVFGTGLYSQASGSSALKRIWAISQATYPNHGLFYVNTPLDAIEVRWDGVKKGEILLETGYIKSFPRIYFGGNYLSQLAASNKVMDSDKVDNEHASAIVTKARVDAQACDHGALVGRGDDDHSQYYNAARHTKAVHDALGILHSSTGGRTANDHHNQAHTLASHSTKAHSELSDAPADAHHPQAHALTTHSDFSTYINQAVLTSSKPQFAGVNLGGATYYLGSGALVSKLYTLLINEIYADVGGPTDPSYTFNGDENTGMYQGGADNLCFATGGGLRMRLTSSLASIHLPLEVPDHTVAGVDRVVNVSFGTGNPPAATGTTRGSLFVKYTA